jgi:MFS family permease
MFSEEQYMTKVNAKVSYKLGYFIVGLGALFYFYEYFLRVAPAVMKPELMHSFALDATMFGTLSAFYFYAYTPMQILVGVLVDRFRLRYIMTFAILCCTAGSFLMAKTHTFELATIGRFLQGFGSAFAYVGALKLAVMWLPAERFAFFSASCTSLGFWGAAFGEIIMSQVVVSFGWRHAIQSFTVVGLILAIAFFIFLRHRPHDNNPELAKHRKIPLKEMGAQLWVAVQKKRIWIAGVLSSLTYLPTSVFAALWGIPYLEKLHGYTANQAAIATSMIFVGWAIGAPIQGWISDHFQSRVRVIMYGTIGAFILSIVLLYSPNMPYSLLCFLFVLFGVCSSVQVLTFAMARDLCSAHIAGTAIAFVNMLAMAGGMIFQRGLGEILDFSWSGHMLHGARVYALGDYEKAVSIVPICLALAIIIALFTKKSRT